MGTNIHTVEWKQFATLKLWSRKLQIIKWELYKLLIEWEDLFDILVWDKIYNIPKQYSSQIWQLFNIQTNN